MTRDATTDPVRTGAGRVGYVMTHYPKLAQTFITDEIEAVERAGLAIACFAMNPPEARELEAPGARERAARTRYLKQSPLSALATLAGQTLRHPVAMARVWGAALRSGGGSPVRSLRRVSHLAQAARVAAVARDENIDRLHAHFGLAPATIAWLATLIARAQGRSEAAFSFTIHGFHDFVDPAETRLDLKAADAAAVLCISDFTRSQAFLGTDPALWPRFRVARCGIDTTAFAYRDPPAIAGTPKLMALGRLSPEKGFAILIDAVARLRDQGTPVLLRIVGDGPCRVELEAAIRQHDLTNAVTLTGELPPAGVRHELAQADIFCMTSFSEGLPISIMEAMAVGVPVVTTWIAGIPELAAEGETALTVPPANADALSSAVGRLIYDTDLRLHLARNARIRVEQQHDLSRCGAQVAAILQGAKE